MENTELVQVAPEHPDLALLIAQLDHYLFELYPPEEVFLVDFEDPYVNDIYFIVAYLNSRPVGCGAIKKLDEEHVELKRFFVEPEFRNKGIARMIMQRLEEEAANQGYKGIKLETGDQQTEAIGFYKKNGYGEIERFGEYADCRSSLCFEKKL
ncbi:Acetyltransferase (GNAT) family protein [Paenibacillus sophorae]|uniref:Acetyltransferase (GNAT) family protein n=1 Tax=Paenibacillus sophorae TaxID=1333845 RepID=A0A1H8QVF9_9BACL|nr:GNAT family N-acetyltransferase [Paenibacillus sophorae]QWU14842.1 GNAT family N-acetyltransferase [Paenibacillus sophorae]SEO57941.1 Acetyltransferase (GNAT) family protein [Paenibacillus sophorae]